MKKHLKKAQLTVLWRESVSKHDLFISQYERVDLSGTKVLRLPSTSYIGFLCSEGAYVLEREINFMKYSEITLKGGDHPANERENVKINHGIDMIKDVVQRNVDTKI